MKVLSKLSASQVSTYRYKMLSLVCSTPLRSHLSPPFGAFCFSWPRTADGKYCLTGGSDRAIHLFNPYRVDPASPPALTIPYALPIKTYAGMHAYPISSIALDTSSSTLVSASDKTIVLADIITGQLIRKVRGHTARINSVTCSHDASLFISASYDSTVKIWDGKSRSQDPIQTLQEARDSVSSVIIVDDKKEILSCSIDGRVRIYDVRKGQLRVDDCGEAITGMCLSHDGLCLAATCLDGNIHLFEKDSGEILNTYSKLHTAGTYGLECKITSNDENVVSGSEDGNVVLYDLISGNMSQILEGHTKPTCYVAVHPKREKCSVMLSASYDGNAVVWASPSEINKWDR